MVFDVTACPRIQYKRLQNKDVCSTAHLAHSDRWTSKGFRCAAVGPSTRERPQHSSETRGVLVFKPSDLQCEANAALAPWLASLRLLTWGPFRPTRLPLPPMPFSRNIFGFYGDFP